MPLQNFVFRLVSAQILFNQKSKNHGNNNKKESDTQSEQWASIQTKEVQNPWGCNNHPTDPNVGYRIGIPDSGQPRETFDDQSLNQLAQSIAQHGVLQPITVRKSDDGYIIVMGERRFRASKLAGLTTIPAMVRDYVDTEVLEVRIIENLQRKDVEPTEEAEAIQFLLDRYEPTEIAQRLGRSENYVRQRVKLAGLIEGFKTFIRRGEMTLGLGVAVALFESEEQKLMLESMEGDFQEHRVKRMIDNRSFDLTQAIYVKIREESDDRGSDVKSLEKRKMSECTPAEQIIKINTRELRKKEIENNNQFKDVVEMIRETDYIDQKKALSIDEMVAISISLFENNIGYYGQRKHFEDFFWGRFPAIQRGTCGPVQTKLQERDVIQTTTVPVDPTGTPWGKQPHQ
ncbi:MAG: ParB/RepB/Spo0J family partition protein [Flavobacteriaceae bacterium]|nr:ParB/RepB/Spo0J family partition protein [Flavobacteriaceae bacterium]